MKVIATTNVSEWSHKHTCSNCDSQLEVEAADLKYSFTSGYGRETDFESFTANCPMCKSYFYIPNSNIPKILQIEAKNRANKSSGYFDR